MAEPKNSSKLHPKTDPVPEGVELPTPEYVPGMRHYVLQESGSIVSPRLARQDLLVMVMIGVLGDILFLIGLPGIQLSQPETGWPGQIGLILIGIGTVIAILASLLIRLAGARLNILAPIQPLGAIFISQLGLFAQAAALIGYGVSMLQRDVPAPEARGSRVSSHLYFTTPALVGGAKG